MYKILLCGKKPPQIYANIKHLNGKGLTNSTTHAKTTIQMPCLFIKRTGCVCQKSRRKSHAETRYRKNAPRQGGAEGAKTAQPKQRCARLVQVMIGQLRGLGGAVDRCQTPSKNKKSLHSNALCQGQLFGFRGGECTELLPLARGLSRETIEPRLAACDWNPELTFRFFRALIEMDDIVLMEMLLHVPEREKIELRSDADGFLL